MKTHKLIVTIEVVVETDHGPDAIATTVLESILHDEGFHDSIAEEIDILQDRFEEEGSEEHTDSTQGDYAIR